MFIPSFFVIKNVLDSRDSWEKDGEWDTDRLSAIELFIEEKNSTFSENTIILNFTELINNLNKICFEQEKKNLLANIDPNSTDYLIKHRELQEKAKKISIKFN
jgi:hypothetical protein